MNVSLDFSPPNDTLEELAKGGTLAPPSSFDISERPIDILCPRPFGGEVGWHPALSPAGARRGPHVLLVVGVRGSNHHGPAMRAVSCHENPLTRPPPSATLSPKGARAESHAFYCSAFDRSFHHKCTNSRAGLNRLRKNSKCGSTTRELGDGKPFPANQNRS